MSTTLLSATLLRSRVPCILPGQLARTAFAAILLCAIAAGAAAQTPDPPKPPPTAPKAAGPELQIPRLDGIIKVDGLLDEAQWSRATKLDAYHMYEPTEEDSLPGKTTAWLFYTDQMLYFGFHCQQPSASLRAHVAPREDINADDQIGIYLDTFRDGRQAFVFYINALGVQQDARLTEPSNWNQSWDTVFYSEGRIQEDGFTVEVAIPFRSLRFPSQQTQDWGIMLTRKFAAQGSKSAWPKLSRDQSGYLSQAGHLEGLEGISSNRNLEIQPTLVADWGEASNRSEASLRPPLTLKLFQPEGATDGGLTLSPGIHAKYGLTSDLTLDATLNPDFSQVEADPNQLDINRRSALYYDERRPFFLEGAEALSGAPYLSLYSRSIVSPLWGLKLTGRQGKYTIGLLNAYDTAPQPSSTLSFEPDLADPHTPGFEQEDLLNADGSSRGALVSVARVARELGDTSLAGITLADKEVYDLQTGEAFGFHRYGAADLQWRLTPKDRITASAELAWTGMRGGSTLSDVGYFLAYEHNSRNLYIYGTHGYEGPDFRAETSFIPYVGVFFTDAFAKYRLNSSLPWLVYVQPQVYLKSFYEPTSGETTEGGGSLGVLTRFAQQYYLVLGFQPQKERYFATDYRQAHVQLELRSETLNRFHWTLGTREGVGLDYNLIFGSSEAPAAANAQLYEIVPYLSLKFRPVPRVQLDAEYYHYLSLDEFHPSPQLLAETLGGSPTPARYSQGVFLGRLNLSLTRAWSVRMVARMRDARAGASGSAALDGSALLTWLPHPGTAAYLGVSGGCSQSWGDELPTAYWEQQCESDGQNTWRMFLKLAYLWRV